MARFEPNHAGIEAFARSNGVRDALQEIAERVQARAAQITAAEAVDTGLMAASWRVEMIPPGRQWIARVLNTATNKESDPPFPYPVAQEWGWRTRHGRHIPGKRILGRALDAARI